MSTQRRTISPRLFRDKRVCAVSLRARWLFASCIANADAEGRIEGEAALLKSMAFPHDEEVRDSVLEQALAELTQDCKEHGGPLVIAYDVAGERYLWLPGFARHQQLRYVARSRLPAPPTDLVRRYGKHGPLPVEPVPNGRPRSPVRQSPTNADEARYERARREAVERWLRTAPKRTLARIEREARAELAAAMADRPQAVERFVPNAVRTRAAQEIGFPPFEEWHEAGDT